MLNEFLDFNVTAKMVAQSASRALGLLIAKYKSAGGMPYDVYTKLYDSLVWPVISYGAAVWGHANCKINMPLSHRAAFAKFRCGVAPLKIETGRYLGQAIEQRLCPFCDNVEDEMHVILYCPAYDTLRNELFSKVSTPLHDFSQLGDVEKIITLFSTDTLVKIVAKTCFSILNTRNALLYK